MYLREHTLPIVVKYNIVDTEGNNTLSKKKYLMPRVKLRFPWQKTFVKTTGENICLAQKKQRRAYNRCNQVPNKIKVDRRVLLENQRMIYRKGGNFFGRFTVNLIWSKKLRSLINKDKTKMKTKYKFSFSKPYFKLKWNKRYLWWKRPSRCNRRTITWYRKSRSSKFNG